MADDGSMKDDVKMPESGDAHDKITKLLAEDKEAGKLIPTRACPEQRA